MTVAIKISDVHKHYGEQVHALRGLSLTIEKGEFFGLLGPNGAGKSTLINIIAGLTCLDSGSISVMGHDVVRSYRQSRRCLGVVPQELVFDPFFTVREMLKIQAGYFGKAKNSVKWIDTLLDGLQLTDKADSNMRALSGGMKRRALIAQALVHKPEVIILDEPTAGVDVELRSSLWEFIKTLHADGHTIVLTTHYLEEAENLCQRIGIVNQGQLIALDDKEVLLAKGVGKTCAVSVSLRSAELELNQYLQTKFKSKSGNEFEFVIDREQDNIISIMDALRDCGGEIIDLRTKEADLEDVFIELTRTS